jgi:hypothetical protein
LCEIGAVLSEACRGEAMKETHVFEWHKWFREGHENAGYDERSGYPRSQRTGENVTLWNLVHSDRC